MKFSESWLRTWVNPKITTQELADQLTMAGLEVDAVEPVAGEFSGVIVGQIVKAEQHPNADKLRVCQVLGADSQQFTVVCGAPNAREGLKVPFAMLGAVLPGDFKIKLAKLRGVESKGMLCGQTELQVGDDDSGLWELAADAPLGADLRTYLNLNDTVIEVDLTPNRSDCLSLRGIARELAALNRCDYTDLAIPAVKPSGDKSLAVDVSAPVACPRYVGRVINGVDAAVDSPAWMQERLRRSDIAPKNALVDITNYVLLELGQPLHAFDLAQIKGGIQVRMAKTDETLTLLNGEELKVGPGTLVIADHERPLALAGIMGGLDSAVSQNTRAIFLESAYFAPLQMAGRAREYGLHTDSSHRFERGVDYNITELAIERATQLILDIVGGNAGPLIKVDQDDTLPAEKNIVLRRQRVTEGLGFSMDDAEIVSILSHLGLNLLSEDAESWQFSVPSYRFDLSIEADLLEELARVYGYNRLPSHTNCFAQTLAPQPESAGDLASLKQQLIARDYREAICYSFIDPALHRAFFGEAEAVELLNPISSELSVMRTSLLPSLLQSTANNLKRQRGRVRLFESGLRFLPNTPEGLEQRPSIAAVCCGTRFAPTWHDNKTALDFYDIKGDLQSLLSCSGLSFEFAAEEIPAFLHPGQSALVKSEGKSVGYVGAFHPELLKSMGIARTVFGFEFDLEVLLRKNVPVFKELSRQPAVERDLAFLVKKTTAAQDVLTAIRKAAGENLKQLKVFDIYSGEGIDSERKSIAFSLTFQHSSRTLNEGEINSAVEAVVMRLRGDFDAILR